MPKIYLLNDSRLIKASLMEACLSLLPAEMALRANNYFNERHKQQFVLGKIMLQYIFNQLQPGLTLDKIQYNAYGRPFINANFNFSLSHSGDFITCIISSGCIVGIDIEHIKPVRLNDGFEGMFTAEEWQTITTHAEHGDYSLFYDGWTAKEAVAKATGNGLSLKFKDIVLYNEYATVNNQCWYITKFNPASDYVTHIACSRKVITPIIKQLSIDDFKKALLCNRNYERLA